MTNLELLKDDLSDNGLVKKLDQLVKLRSNCNQNIYNNRKKGEIKKENFWQTKREKINQEITEVEKKMKNSMAQKSINSTSIISRKIKNQKKIENSTPYPFVIYFLICLILVACYCIMTYESLSFFSKFDFSEISQNKSNFILDFIKKYSHFLMIFILEGMCLVSSLIYGHHKNVDNKKSKFWRNVLITIIFLNLSIFTVSVINTHMQKINSIKEKRFEKLQQQLDKLKKDKRSILNAQKTPYIEALKASIEAAKEKRRESYLFAKNHTLGERRKAETLEKKYQENTQKIISMLSQKKSDDSISIEDTKYIKKMEFLTNSKVNQSYSAMIIILVVRIIVQFFAILCGMVLGERLKFSI
jgi:hypothetical protein